MGPDAANLVSSLAGSLEVDRSAGVTQRASDAAQAELVDESYAALNNKKAEAAAELNKERIRREHEKRRREMERRARLGGLEDDSGGDVTGLDVVA